MSRACIVCRVTQPECSFNKEHVFPAAIDGRLTIQSVCSSCNEALGVVVDAPFLEHELIGVYRHIFGLKRGKRKISNPFRKFNRDNNFSHTLFVKDGILKAYHKTQQETVETKEYGTVVNLSIDKAFEKQHLGNPLKLKGELQKNGVLPQIKLTIS